MCGCVGVRMDMFGGFFCIALVRELWGDVRVCVCVRVSVRTRGELWITIV